MLKLFSRKELILDNNLDKLTSKMAHDVKNSVAVLMMLAYTLKDKLSEEEYNIIEEEAGKIDKIIEEYRQQLK